MKKKISFFFLKFRVYHDHNLPFLFYCVYRNVTLFYQLSYGINMLGTGMIKLRRSFRTPDLEVVCVFENTADFGCLLPLPALGLEKEDIHHNQLSHGEIMTSPSLLAGHRFKFWIFEAQKPILWGHGKPLIPYEVIEFLTANLPQKCFYFFRTSLINSSS